MKDNRTSVKRSLLVSAIALTLTAALPAALIVLLAWGLGWGLLSDVLGPAGWANRTDAAGGVAVLLALSGVVAWRRRGLVVFFGRDAMAFAAFVSLTSFFVWIVATQPLALWSRMTSSGTDFLRHLGMIATSGSWRRFWFLQTKKLPT